MHRILTGAVLVEKIDHLTELRLFRVRLIPALKQLFRTINHPRNANERGHRSSMTVG